MRHHFYRRNYLLMLACLLCTELTGLYFHVNYAIGHVSDVSDL